MKTLTFFLLTLLGIQFASAQYCGFSGPNVCTPQGAPTSPGFNPPPQQWGALVNGQQYNTNVGFLNWDSILQAGTLITIDSMRIDSVNNLPAGICWSTNVAGNMVPRGQYICVDLAGTPCAAPGQYKMNIYITLYTQPFGGLSANMDAANVFAFIRVANPGETPPPVDTSQRAGNAFIPYGPAAFCQSSPVPVLNLGPDALACTGSQLILNPFIYGGVTPYTYTWISTGDALSCANCLNPTVTLTQNSTYILAVTDANGNVAVDTVNYSLNAGTNAVSASFSNTNLGCNSSTDTTSVTLTGGTAPFSINWGNGQAETGLGSAARYFYTVPGAYIIEVTDANGCVTTAIDSVLNTGVGIALTQTIQPNCPSENTGALTVSPTGGTAPYTYYWNNASATPTISNIPVGFYAVTVTDAASCSASSVYYLTSLSDTWGYYVYLQTTDANCGNNGGIQASVYGGLNPYTYSWSPAASNTPNISGLASGNYLITVTDSVGCSTTGSAFVATSCSSYITGFIFGDVNNNCTQDTGEWGRTGLISATSSLGNTFYGCSDGAGNFSIQVSDPGAYTLSADYFFFGLNCANVSICSSPANPVIANLGDTASNVVIGVGNSAQSFDIAVHPGWNSANPGFTKNYWIYYYNNSNTPYLGPALITFTYDSNLVYQYSSGPQPVVNLATHTLVWSVDTVPPYFYAQLETYFMVPSTLSLNYMLQSDFSITPSAGDCDSSNNYFHSSEIVTGSHDPNEKDVQPANNIAPEDSMLTYTIHFQNDGTDSTHFVIVKDTLSSNLDAGTARTVASSAKVSNFTITGKGILTWVFNPLRLPDSSTNVNASKGFVTFTVKKKSNLPLGTIISNTASIYFDYNSAVVTNTVADTVALPTAIITLHDNSNNVSVKAFPNPFKDATNIVVTGLNQKYDFELYDVTGRLLRRIPSVNTNQFQLQQDNMAAGLYLYRLMVDGKLAANGKLVVE